MRYLAEDNLDIIHRFGERVAGPSLSRGIARLYSHHTRLRAGTAGLSSWTNDEFSARLNEAEKLLVAGLALADSSDQRRYLRRAGEIFEWLATTTPPATPTEMSASVVLLAASAYQLAGYPARALGVLTEHPLSDATSRVLEALLRADFGRAQELLLDVWRLPKQEGEINQISMAVLDQLLRAIGVFAAWMRWGNEQRIEMALNTIDKVARASLYDIDRFSWLLSEAFSAIVRKFRDNALWTVLSPLMEAMSTAGKRAIDRYARVAFLERKLLVWPSQREGINGIVSEGSFALCTPTGSGKTRVAELVILRHLFGQRDSGNNGNEPLVLYLAPSRALSAQVESSLSHVLRNIHASSVAVTSLYGGGDFGPSDLATLGEQPTVIISTHEKAEALLRFLGTDLLKQVSCVIVDEAHTASFTGEYDALANAQSRSLRLETLISRLKTLCMPDTTFVALSAVAAEIKDVLSAWISGVAGKKAIAPDYRSTRQLLGQLLCFENGASTIRYDVLDGQPLTVTDQDSAPYVPNPFPPHPPVTAAFDQSAGIETKMRAHLLWAAMHFARPSDGRRHSVLISVTEHPEWYAKTFLTLLTEDWAEEDYPDFFTPPENERDNELFLRSLESCDDYFGPESLEYQLLKKGIALHHGKMPPAMSRLLIDLIQSHVINIVIATSTLSEGVNLPFETVLIPSLRRSRSAVPVREIVNVAGRAGRPGVSTEGKTLVLLAPHSSQPGQIIARRAYQQVVESMTSSEGGDADTITSPLYALISKIMVLWSKLSGNHDVDMFIEWLEKAAYTQTKGDELQLLTALDTLDQQLIAGIEEYESIGLSASLEEFLQSLWRNTLARYESKDNAAELAFIQRGLAVAKTIYPERKTRRALYYTGLPPRDGTVLLDMLSDIKATLQEAVDYLSWDTAAQVTYFSRLIETASQIESFKVTDLQIGRARIGWREIFEWWMAGSVNRRPNPNNVSRWYDYASKNFVFGLNWALGAIVGSIIDRDGGEGELLERWQRCKLPWSVLWFKDMVSWGVLDPVASYVLARRGAFTRSEARAIAADYWKSIDEVNDAVLDPRRVAEWMQKRKLTVDASKEDKCLPPSEIHVSLIEDFSSYTGQKLRVLPVIENHRIDWYDPAGFVLASSSIPEYWQGLEGSAVDFVLDPLASVVEWKYYV